MNENILTTVFYRIFTGVYQINAFLIFTQRLIVIYYKVFSSNETIFEFDLQVAWVKKPNPFPIAIDTEIFDPAMKNIRINHERHSHNSQSWNLVIEHAQPSDSGVYECQVTSKTPLSFDINLHVLGK